MSETQGCGRQTADQLFHSSQASGKRMVDSKPLTQDELDQESDRQLKKRYAFWFLVILAVQLAVMNVVFICQGLGWVNFDEVTLRFYTTSTIAQVFGVVFIIANSLFPTKKPS